MSTKQKWIPSEQVFKEFGDLTFGKILWAHRSCDEITQVKFAKKLGISAANLCDLEKGRKIPSPKRAVKIAKKLGLPEMFLVQIALEDLLRRDKIKCKVTVVAA